MSSDIGKQPKRLLDQSENNMENSKEVKVVLYMYSKRERSMAFGLGIPTKQEYNCSQNAPIRDSYPCSYVTGMCPHIDRKINIAHQNLPFRDENKVVILQRRTNFNSMDSQRVSR
jgi:hypothetical protein